MRRLNEAAQEMHDNLNFSIGIFDSGIGGLSVLRAIRAKMPGERIIFLGDQAHVPYGSRRMSEVREFSEQITRYLLDRRARLIVVACNTASAAALKHLRNTFPEIPFVGMEPAVKPAAEQTQSRVVGVLATPATFQGELYASVVERFASGVTILQDACPGLVGQIEKGELETAETESILRRALRPMLEKGIDTVVLGCTHYPFVIPLIQSIVGSQVRVIDPAPAIARQVERLLGETKSSLPIGDSENVTYLTTADADSMQLLLPRFLGESGTVAEIRWKDGCLF
ncbi:MAG: glutamate racemase [Chloroflexi bacterium]|nr:glutamate racemase [Chloroflexota bacterium]